MLVSYRSSTQLYALNTIYISDKHRLVNIFRLMETEIKKIMMFESRSLSKACIGLQLTGKVETPCDCSGKLNVGLLKREGAAETLEVVI